MTDRQDVDVVILSLNRAEMTEACINSVLQQENIYPNIWIIDQGSDEAQLRMLKKALEDNPQVRLVELKKNIGVPAGRNLGMKLGRSNYIFCIDNDAEYGSEKEIVRAVDQLNKDEKIAVLGFKINNYFTNDLDHTSWSYPKTMLARQDETFLTTRFCGAGHAIRRSALEQTDYYDENLFFYWEEVDLSYQLINLGYQIEYFPNVKIRHKVSTENKVLWDGNRYYFMVRNILYLNWNYYRSWSSFLVFAIGYLIKGILNGVGRQSIRGINDSIKMCHEMKCNDKKILTSESRRYIYTYDTSVRGSFFTRLKNEIFTRLPGRK
jgi:GT2 family glycosyltransferase